MNLASIVLLAILQGLTEFLPVSSSGHLVLADALLGLREPGVVTEVVLHLGTLLAVLIYFRNDLAALVRDALLFLSPRRERIDQDQRRLLIALIVGTVPIVFAGAFFDTIVERLFESPGTAAIALIVTGLILLSTTVVRKSAVPIGAGRALMIGIAQAFALVPGISRSGMTISAGIFLGLDPTRAARFSFLLSVPAIFGATIYKLPEIAGRIREADGILLLLGFLIAFAVGYAAIVILLWFVQKGRFGWFGLYCLLLGIVGWITLR